MSFKNTFWIIFLTLFASNFALAEETIFNYSPDSVYSNKGRLSHNVGKIDSKSVFEKTKKDFGFGAHKISIFKLG